VLDAHVHVKVDLAAVLLERYGAGVLPASAFGEDPAALRVRVATGLLYGDTDEQREETLAAADPVALPWVAAALDRIDYRGPLAIEREAGNQRMADVKTAVESLREAAAS